ncbi:MAG: hypothetical protein RIF32_13550 [Leptospirales bacterium]|jgi:hypothetical protein
MTRPRLFIPSAHTSIALRGVLLIAFALTALQPAGAARDDLPTGRWQARDSALHLEILSKNAVRLFTEKNTTAFEVGFAPEARVRHEYWMGIESLKTVEHKVETPKPTEQSAVPEKQTDDDGPLVLPWLTKDAKVIVSFLTEYPPPEKKSQSKARKKAVRAQPAAAPGQGTNGQRSNSDAPARDAQKTAAADGKANPGTAVQNGATNPSQPGDATRKAAAKPPRKRRPKGPIPIIELLVFRDGKLVHEAIFERVR